MIVSSVVKIPGTSEFEEPPGLSPRSDWDPIWHYTNGAGLLGIIQDDAIWASSALTLNDASEVEFGMTVLDDVWTTMRDQYPPGIATLIDDMLGESAQRAARQDIFIACASRHRDSLNQWQGYAGAQGYAISLNTRTPWCVHLNSREDFEGPRKFTPVWVDVIYDPDDQRALAQECLHFYADRYLPNAQVGHIAVAARLLSAVSARFKHNGFKDEGEVRLIYVKPYDMRERFRTGARGLVPYLQLASPADAKARVVSYDPPRRLHTWEIVCGPSDESERDAIRHAVKRLLTVQGHGKEVKVTSSTIPYRFT
jgi:hypothetical protein